MTAKPRPDDRRPIARTGASGGDPKGEVPLKPATHAFALTVIIERQREAMIDRLVRPVGSSFVRHRVLVVVGRLQPCSMGDLALFSASDRTTLTRTVDQLVAAGLVVRQTPPTDRRQVLLSLTPEGEASRARSLALVDGFNDRAIAGIGDDDLRTALRVLEKIAENLIDDPARARRVLGPPDSADASS